MTLFRTRVPRIVLSMLLLALIGCSADDGADVRVLGSESGASSSSGSATGSGVSLASCSPVNPDLAEQAAQTVEISAIDFAYQPDELTVPAGTTTFTLINEGSANHELAFLPGGGEVPLNEDGSPDEGALEEAGAFELEGIAPGESCDATYELEAGDYTVFCVIAADDGRTHYELGMEADLTVG